MKVGVLGGGQLGRMIALAGYPFELEFRFFETDDDCPAGQVADLVHGSYDDPAALERFRQGLDIVTYEFENVPVAAVEAIAKHIPVFPPPIALKVAQDRLNEKQTFQKLNIPTPRFLPIESRAELENACKEIGLPSVLKTRRLGYDGKGQCVLRDTRDISQAFESIGGVPLILEGFVPFDRELSILAVRNAAGEMAFYPLVENHHAGGILRLSIAPAPAVPAELQTQAESYVRRLADELNYVGVLALELFEIDGKLLANEMAPRVHNSGHWTIEGASSSQFENHLRAGLGLPLGNTNAIGHSAMVNLIGVVPPLERMLAEPDTHPHLYGKEARVGRKLGHVTVHSDEPARPRAIAQRLMQLSQPPTDNGGTE